MGSALTCWFRHSGRPSAGGCGQFGGVCGWFGGGSCNGWSTGHSVNCTEALSIMVRIIFKSHHHFITTGQHQVRHLVPTEVA